MPWNEVSIVSQRQRLIEQLLLPGMNRREVIESFGISRTTAYKWLSRYQAEQLSGLQDKSREPHRQPTKTDNAFEELVINLHREHPYWGPRKLRDYLLHIENYPAVPSHTTFSRILKRHHCEIIRSNKSASATKRFERQEPNDLWQMDFKGHFKTNQSNCYPLTILDDHSRYSVCLQACPDERGSTVKTHLQRVFEMFGLPRQINVDNGNPWGSADLESPVSLAIWLMKLGIKVTHSAPYHPQTNGKDERFHRTLKLEVIHQRLYKNNHSVQKAFNEWQHIYNFKRPHQSLYGKPPSSRYRPSDRPYPAKLPEPQYDECNIIKKVHKTNGTIRFRGSKYRVGKGFADEFIELRETDEDGIYAVFFIDSFVKKLDTTKSKS